MLCEAERRKRPKGWRSKTWMLNHDSAPAHTALLAREFYRSTGRLSSPPTAPLSRFGPCRLLFVPDVEIPSEMSTISDYTRDRRKFYMRPMRYAGKHVPELGKKVGSGEYTMEGSTSKETILIKL
jgi:hypothetical protein